MARFKVMLVNAPTLGVIEPWQDTPDFGRVSLAYLTSYLRAQQPDVEIVVVDAKLERLGFQAVLQRAIDFGPHVVGLTAFTNEIKPAAYQAAIIKRALPGVHTVIGGAHLTALPEGTLREFPSFDIGVIDEGEVTFAELCAAIAAGGSIESIDGLVFRTGGRLQRTKPRGRILDQDSIPFPAWDLFPRTKVYWVQSSRGCPFNCVFCMNHNGRVARRRTVANVMQELNHIVDTYRPEWIRFGDELFSVDAERTMDLLDEMIRAGIGDRVKWDVQTHVRFVNEKMFRKFKEAKVVQVDMGVETGDEAQLKRLGKGIDIKLASDAFRAAKKVGVKTGAFLLFGQPNETGASIRTTIDLAVRINPDVPMFGMMVPYPGTEVARMAARNECGYRNLSANWDEYRKQIGGAVEFSNVSRTQAELLQILGYLSVFLRNGRILDFLRFALSYRVEAIRLLTKVFWNQTGVECFFNLPEAYADVLAGQGIDLEEVACSKEKFEVIQRAEMERARRNRPELLDGVRAVSGHITVTTDTAEISGQPSRRLAPRLV